MKAPEKIYIAFNELTEDGRTFVLDHRVDYPICTEYTRTDAFVEKLEKWVKGYIFRNHFKQDFANMLINDFKNYIKGE